MAAAKSSSRIPTTAATVAYPSRREKWGRIWADQWANWVNFEGKLGYPKFMHIFIFSYIRIYIYTLYFTGIILVGFNGYFNNFEPLEYLNLLSFYSD